MAAKRGDKAGEKPATIVIRREDGGGDGHHGGAWKVAYADFVTAMMAFFLLMWLLNSTTPEQRHGIADYFSPTNIFSSTTSGNGKPFGGSTPNDSNTMVSSAGAVQVVVGKVPPVQDVVEDDTDTPAEPHPFRNDPTAKPEQPDEQAVNATQASGPATGAAAGAAAGTAKGATAARQSAAGAGLLSNLPPAGTAQVKGEPQLAAAAAQAAERDKQERAAFAAAAQQIREAVHNDPALADLARQLAVDLTPEGLRIQIMDEDKRPMFASGSATMNDRARLLLQKVAPVLMKLSEKVSIAGHTDAAQFRGAQHSNWDLSAERANATRRLLVEAGLPEGRIRSVTGNADRDLLLPGDPLAAANRRVAIVVLRNAVRPPPPPPVDAEAEPAAGDAAQATTAPMGPGAAAPMAPGAAALMAPGATAPMGPGAAAPMAPGTAAPMGPGAAAPMAPGVAAATPVSAQAAGAATALPAAASAAPASDAIPALPLPAATLPAAIIPAGPPVGPRPAAPAVPAQPAAAGPSAAVILLAPPAFAATATQGQAARDASLSPPPAAPRPAGAP